jgi:hypothetical protein
MKYSYEFKRNPLGYLRIILPQEINLFSDFIEDIVFETEVDEYIDIVHKVMEGEYGEFEIEGNATSVLIKKIQRFCTTFISSIRQMRIK